ncbi:MAG: NmrA family transcriptional regulator [Bradyrhizobium sp.]|nr:NmrA family transcriptional regulator [Bradyrhizobium sp.]
MAILIIGSTGKVGTEVIRHLPVGEVEVLALTRDPDKASFPAGVRPVKGDLLDIDHMRTVYKEVSTVFMINPAAKDELAQVLLSLRLATEAGVKGIVYSSMLNSEVFADTPHSVAKYSGERMIEQYELPASVLRPTYFMQNDFLQKEALTRGFFAMPLGSVGVSMIDVRDIAEVAAAELVRREKSATPLAASTLDLVGPAFTGTEAAAIWSDVLQRPVRYGGDDVGPLYQRIASRAGSWLAYDQSLMYHGFHRTGMLPKPGSIEKLETALGHPVRSYRAFVEEVAQLWAL